MLDVFVLRDLIYLDGSFAFGNFINDALNGRNIVIQSDGSAIRSYLYAADLVVWLLRIASKGEDRETYNVGSSKAITVRELAHYIGKINKDVNVDIQYNHTSEKSIYLPCVQKATISLGLTENFTLEDMINKTNLFYKQ